MVKIGFLGPKGTFSHEALLAYAKDMKYEAYDYASIQGSPGDLDPAWEERARRTGPILQSTEVALQLEPALLPGDAPTGASAAGAGVDEPREVERGRVRPVAAVVEPEHRGDPEAPAR